MRDWATARRRSSAELTHFNVAGLSTLCYDVSVTQIVDVPLETVIGKLKELAPELRAEGVIKLCLFGSRARGDARPDSDLDILVETTPAGGSPRFDYFNVLHLIEDNIGLQVQISMRDALKPRIAERIADDLIEVF
jgi:hypothetical protein